jgi:hypothetical protein
MTEGSPGRRAGSPVEGGLERAGGWRGGVERGGGEGQRGMGGDGEKYGNGEGARVGGAERQPRRVGGLSGTGS